MAHPSHNRIVKSFRPKRLARLELGGPGTIALVCHRTTIADPEAPGGPGDRMWKPGTFASARCGS